MIWTGDIVAHDIWNTSRKTNLEIIDYTIRALVSYLPGIPVFPALGNHEGEPVDRYSREVSFLIPFITHKSIMLCRNSEYIDIDFI